MFLELGGNAVVYSINYDRLLSNDFGLRFGIMAFGVSASDAGAMAVGVPVTGSYFIGENNHRLELGAGILYLSAAVGSGDFSGSGSAVAPTGIIGYRYQPVDGGFFFKAGFTPFVYNNQFIPYGGISLGYTF